MEHHSTAYKALSDAVLLELLKCSDHKAYEEIYRRYWAILFRHAKRMLSNDDEVKDLVQDVFVCLWNKATDLVIETSLSGYLYGMVRYKFFDLIDKQKIRHNHLQSLADFIDKGECTTDHRLRENELSRIIEREVSSLPAKMKEVFELSRKSHFTYQQISVKMEISNQTVKKQVFNALKILRLNLESIGVL